MANIDYLYDDPDWLLQAGLGDIEFEQDMYDDIVYGEPAEQEEWRREKLLRQMYLLYQRPDYDELGLMGLRRHSMQGPMRYLYDQNLKDPFPFLSSHKNKVENQDTWAKQADFQVVWEYWVVVHQTKWILILIKFFMELIIKEEDNGIHLKDLFRITFPISTGMNTSILCFQGD